MRREERGDQGQTALSVDGDVLEIQLLGYMTGTALDTCISQVRALGSRTDLRFAYFDATPMTGFSPDVARPGNTLLDVLRSQLGIRFCLACSDSTAVRMMGQTIAFAARMPLRFVSSRTEAHRIFEQRRAGS
ncbi:MAG: hypothetical protein HOW73_10840 [Polyangiaceae bacterium]|nr:hypothetical protein [Polyangiaceae bacterium]